MKIGLIGYGNLARTLVAGLKTCKADLDIAMTAKSKETKELAKSQNLEAFDTTGEMLSHVDLLILAVPSKGLEQLRTEGLAVGDVPLVSFVAGLTIASIREKTGASTVCRVIPNVAMRVCTSVSAIAWGEGFTEKQKEDVLSVFSAVGTVIEGSEEQLDIITSVSSSGIAFAARYIEGFEKKGRSLGLTKEQATLVAAGTFDGAVQLIADGMSPSALVDAVATKGGSTYEGIVQMEADDTDGITSRTIDRAYEKLVRFKQGQDLH